MSDTKIEWAHPPGYDGETWNPTLGCSKISPGCKGCYAIRSVRRMSGNPNAKIAAANAGLVVMTGAGLNWTGKVNTLKDRLSIPLKKKRPTAYFVNSLSDLFHEEITDEFIDQVFAMMALCPQHRFLILTKRPARMLTYLSYERRPHVLRDAIYRWHASQACSGFRLSNSLKEHPLAVAQELSNRLNSPLWPLRNVWLGVSVENQATADERIPLLLQAPAAKKFISYEPALGPIDFWYPESLYPGGPKTCCDGRECGCMGKPIDPPLIYGIDQIIIGGESGPDARPMHPGWVTSTRDQCLAANVAFFFKQWGAYVPWGLAQKPVLDRGRRYVFFDGKCLKFDDTNGGLDKRDSAIMQHVGKKQAGAMLEGREWREFPASQA